MKRFVMLMAICGLLLGWPCGVGVAQTVSDGLPVKALTHAKGSVKAAGKKAKRHAGKKGKRTGGKRAHGKKGKKAGGHRHTVAAHATKHTVL